MSTKRQDIAEWHSLSLDMTLFAFFQSAFFLEFVKSLKSSDCLGLRQMLVTRPVAMGAVDDCRWSLGMTLLLCLQRSS